jgi:hypothetical protein
MATPPTRPASPPCPPQRPPSPSAIRTQWRDCENDGELLISPVVHGESLRRPQRARPWPPMHSPTQASDPAAIARRILVLRGHRGIRRFGGTEADLQAISASRSATWRSPRWSQSVTTPSAACLCGQSLRQVAGGARRAHRAGAEARGIGEAGCDTSTHPACCASRLSRRTGRPVGCACRYSGQRLSSRLRLPHPPSSRLTDVTVATSPVRRLPALVPSPVRATRETAP